MNDTTVLPSASDAGQAPVINVIEPDLPAAVDSVVGAAPDTGRLDQAAGDAVAARRRREFDAARARLREQAIHGDRRLSQHDEHPTTTPSGERRDADAQPNPDMPREAVLRRAPLGDPPERVRKRYLRSGNQYFLKEAPYQLAFEDIGPYLVTEHNRPDVVESMVDIVRAKAWERIRVSGHEAFRREAWLQATLLGIEVSGYQPKAADLARIAEGRRERMTNRIDAGEPASSATGGAREADVVREGLPLNAVPPAREDAASRHEPPGSAPAQPQKSAPASMPRRTALPTELDEPERQHYAGELMEHGGAPYQHNPARSDSYYVVYRDQAGADHVVWGVDLERAVVESGATPGQQVTLENLGKRHVTVTVPVVDAAGQVISEEEKDVYRNTWAVDIVGRERTRLVERAQSPPEHDPRAGQTQVGPEIVRADRRSATPQAVPEDRAMQLAVIVAAMREQGFSERSIVRVQQRAERMLDAFHAEGIPIPVPRVFDPKAPSARSRRVRPAAEQVLDREVERAPSEPSPPTL